MRGTRRRLFLLLAVLVGTSSLTAGPARSQVDPVSEKDRGPLVFATRHAPPFAIKTDHGWAGITPDLIRRIAEEEGFGYEFREVGLEQMLDAVAKGQVSGAAAALTITSERERRVDFTHPFFTSGLGVAVPQRRDTTLFSALQRIASGPFLHAMAALLGVLTLLGALIWLAERRRNHQFPKDPVKGIGSGIWWSAVTMTTVGYGDKAPMTLAGRVIGLIWMFASIILISGFTAAIASSLTVGQLDQSISGLQDLYGKRVLTVPGSTSAAFLDEELVRFRAAPDAADALNQLAAGRADAVVYDVPILRYLVNEHHGADLRVLPNLLARQDDGIALPAGAPLREAFNLRILRIIQSPEWTRMLEGYLGRDG